MLVKDYVLGQKVEQLLISLGLENQIINDNILKWQEQSHIDMLEHKLSEFLHALGFDLDASIIRNVPNRMVKYFTQELFYGLDYRNFPSMLTMANNFAYKSPLFSQGITVHSSCEHHLATIKGVATIAYIPDKKLIGFGKINQLVNFFAHRPQLQERLTRQINVVLQNLLGTPDVAVSIIATHDCIVMRGIDGDNSKVTTYELSGRFSSDSNLNQQFFSTINTSHN